MVLFVASVVCFIAANFVDSHWLEPPAGFVETESGLAYKAVSPDGSVVAVRYRENEERGDLDFWSEVFEREMVEAKGYRLVESEKTSSGDGVDGTTFLFEYAHGDVPYHYGLSVYVTDESLVTLESATVLAEHARYAEAFEEARTGLQVRTMESNSKLYLGLLGMILLFVAPFAAFLTWYSNRRAAKA